MATIATTSNAAPFIYPGTTLLDRDPITGYLYCMIKASTADNYTIYRSTNGGTSWSSYLNLVRTGVQEIGPIFVHDDSFLHWVYRTNESSQDRIYHRVADLTTGAWESELLVSGVGNGGVAGAVFNGGMDLSVIKTGDGYFRIPIAVSKVYGSQVGVQMHGVLIDGNTRVSIVHNSLFTTWRDWASTATGRQSPSVDLEHTGNAKGSGTPNLWVCFGRTRLESMKFAWNGHGWNTPTSTVLINASVTAMDAQSARWDGSRWLIPVPVASTVVVYERNRANSTTTTRTSPTHPTGVVRNCTISYSHTSGDFRVYAVGTSTTVLYYVDYIRSTGLWSAWSTVLATAVLGSSGNNYGVRRASHYDAKYTVYTAHAASSTISTTQGITYAPFTPTWTTAGLSYTDGGAADVGAPLVLDWVFTDPDTSDVQGSYAVSRQIGAGALAYWRASDSTWQAGEVQNTSASTTITLPVAWGTDGAAAHAYKVKVWDAGGAFSAYSAALTVIPSARVNPVITSPAAGATVTTDTVPVTWTAAEQTQYRVQVISAAAYDTFTRAVSSTWGSAESGQAWTTSGGSASDYSTSSNRGRHSLGTVTVVRESALTISTADVDLTIGRIALSALPTGAGAEVGIRVRYVDTNNYVDVRVFMNTANTITMSIRELVGGVSTGSGFPAVSGATATSPVAVRLQAIGTTLRARAWLTSGEEPDTWTVSMTTSHIAAGALRIRSNLGSANTNVLPLTMDFDDLVVLDTSAGSDSGWVTDAATRTYTPGLVLPDLTLWQAIVNTKNLDGLESTRAVAHFAVDYIEPATPTLVCTPAPASGWIALAVTNPAPGGGQPEVAHNDIYRRVTADGGDGIRIAAGLASGAPYNDWRAVSGVAYEYQVHTIGANGASIRSAWTA